MFDQNKCISSSVLICLLKKKTDYVLLISYWSPDVCSSDLPEVTGPVMLVGFCYGGGVAFNVAAIEPVDALVSFYGSALPNLLELAPQVTAASLHHFGAADDFIPLPVVETIRDAVTREGVQVPLYPDAGHAFDNHRPGFPPPEASALAWERTPTFHGEKRT